MTNQEFFKDLKEVFDKHKVKVTFHENYDGEDNYVGSDMYLVFGKEIDYSKTVGEYFKSLNIETL